MLAHLCLNIDFRGGSVSKESTCNAGDTGSIPGLGKFSAEGKGNPLQYSCLGNPMERSLVGNSSWDHKELNMTYQLNHQPPGPVFKKGLFNSIKWMGIYRY